MNNFSPAPPPEPDFDRLTLLCPCCGLERQDKYLKIVMHDVSQLFGHPTGSIHINCKYCVDVDQCKKKAHDREWVIDHFFKNFMKAQGIDFQKS
jgi:hypothetical protein